MGQDRGLLLEMVFRRFLRSRFVLLCELVRRRSCLVGLMYCSCSRIWNPFSGDMVGERGGRQ
jgi:hypothetical protein